MMTISKDQLTKILAAHKEWRASGGRSGARADLAGANLARADLADAYLAGADLAGADLARANLARADLADAYLAGADLVGANLADADLADAYLAGADLAGANLAGANLARADLAGANLARADLADAYLAGADLAGADLARADLADAYLAGADLAGADLARAPQPRKTREEWEANRARTAAERARRYREKHPDVPVVEALDAKILAVIESGEGKLEMGNWHSCETTHCRAGWAIHLAGKPGYELEVKYDSAVAGRMIYLASTGRAPHFYATNTAALEDIKRCAGTPVNP